MKEPCKFKIGDSVKPLKNTYGWFTDEVLVISDIIWADDYRKYLLCDDRKDKDFGLFEHEVRPLSKLEKALL